MTNTQTSAGTVRMSDGTTRTARTHGDGRVEFWTFGNANSTRGHGWRKASAAQAATFAADEPADAAAAERARGPVLDADIPPLMSITEVAAHHGVSRQAVHDAIKAGKLPAVQVGTTWVMRREVVESVGVHGVAVDQGDDLAAWLPRLHQGVPAFRERSQHTRPRGVRV